jgi:iron(III) transport system substrate-binding protein
MKCFKLTVMLTFAILSADIHTVLADTKDNSVSVYSSRKEYLIQPLLDKFTEKTGIKVKLLTGKDDALITRLGSEGKNSPADILITADAGRLYRAKVAGLLQAVESPILQQNIPANLRDVDNQWFGLSMRARVIMYNKNKVSAGELSTYEALTDPKWKGRICIRSSDNIYNQSLLASMIASNGEQAAEAWAKGVVANMARPPKGNDRAQMSAAVVGECDLAVANTYYYASWLTSDKAADRENAKHLGVFFPNQNDRGAHVNVSGGGVTHFAKNKKAATELLEFLSTEDSQKWYAQVNNEYPVKPGVPASELVQSWGYPFKADSLNLSRLGELNATAVKVFDRSGWK